MPLEDLLKTIETLRGRIEEHGTALRKSEAQTRYALVDPLLRGLGDPTQVVPEYRTQTGPADYSLLDREGEPALMLEAKKLGRALSDGLIQSIGYCVDKGTRFFAVTDGQHWEVYETHKPVPTNEKLVAKFDLKTSPSEVCLKALRCGVRVSRQGTSGRGKHRWREATHRRTRDCRPAPQWACPEEPTRSMNRRPVVSPVTRPDTRRNWPPRPTARPYLQTPSRG